MRITTRLEEGPAHDRVTVWQDGGNCGTLTVKKGTGKYLAHIATIAQCPTYHSDEWADMLARSPYDISDCVICGKPVIYIPDGLPCCEPCGKAEEARQA